MSTLVAATRRCTVHDQTYTADSRTCAADAKARPDEEATA